MIFKQQLQLKYVNTSMEIFYAQKCIATMMKVLFMFLHSSHNAVTGVIRYFLHFMCVIIILIGALKGKEEKVEILP